MLWWECFSQSQWNQHWMSGRSSQKGMCLTSFLQGLPSGPPWSHILIPVEGGLNSTVTPRAVCPYGYCKRGTSSGVFFEGQQRESIFAIPGFRPGLPTHHRYVTFWGVNATSCRKPSCLAKAQNHVRTSQGPSVRAAGQPSTAFCECGRSLEDKPLLH